MFERETKREKILETRQKEMRLKERSRSEQSKGEETGREEGEEDPEQLIESTEADFYTMVEMELKRREKRNETLQVRWRERPLFITPVCFVLIIHNIYYTGVTCLYCTPLNGSITVGLCLFLFFFSRKKTPVKKRKSIAEQKLWISFHISQTRCRYFIVVNRTWKADAQHCPFLWFSDERLIDILLFVSFSFSRTYVWISDETRWLLFSINLWCTSCCTLGLFISLEMLFYFIIW